MSMKQVTPILPVRDIEAAITFYEEVLRFRCAFRVEGYAYLSRDNIGLRLIKASATKDMGSPDSQIHIYIDVEDVDAQFAEMKDALSKLPEGRLNPPFETHYGQREFHVTDLDVTLISFGSPV